MNLTDLQKHWSALGVSDPFWAILSDPAKRHGGWEPEEFFGTGRDWIDRVIRYVDSLGVAAQRDQALDFGCGAGRLTQALCRHFARCDGVDIAPTMLELAHRFNRHGDRCRYHLNGSDDLRLFADDTFDFVYTIIVLQHMEPQYSTRYLREFLRVLKPGGVVMFQLPGAVIPFGPDGAVMRGARSRGTRPLPAGATRAAVTLLDLPDGRPAGSQHRLRAQVRNLGDAAWPARGDDDGRYRVKLASRWLDAAGSRVVRQGDSGTLLPGDVAPGTEVELPLLVTVPSQPGRYVLEAGVVQEAMAGSDGEQLFPARVPFEAWPATAPSGETADGAAAEATPDIQMHGVPRHQVLDLIRSAGGRVLDVTEDQMAGEYWESFTYCVTK